MRVNIFKKMFVTGDLYYLYSPSSPHIPQQDCEQTLTLFRAAGDQKRNADRNATILFLKTFGMGMMKKNCTFDLEHDPAVVE